MGKKKGKKSGAQKEEQATGVQPEKKTALGKGDGVQQQPGPSQTKQQQEKQHEKPPELSVRDVAGPSQQSEEQKKQELQPQTHLQSEQPLKPPAYDGRKKGKKKSQAEHGPGVPPQQALQALGQRKEPTEAAPPPVIRDPTSEAVRPPLGMGKSRGPAPPQESRFVPVSRGRGGPSPPQESRSVTVGRGQGGPSPPQESRSVPIGRGQGGPSPPQESRSVPIGRGRGGPSPQSHMAQAQARPGAPTVAGTGKLPTKDDVADITQRVKALCIPRRKDLGTKGRRTVVETNYFSLDFSKLRNKIAIHYDVDVNPSLPKRLTRLAMEEFRRRNFPDRYPAFDGRKNLYSSLELPEISDEITICDEESRREKTCTVTIKRASQVNLESLTSYMRGGSSMEQPQRAIQAIDVVLRNAPAFCGHVQVGRSFFTPPRGRVLQLGDGLEMWYGIFQSAVLGWKPFVNIDVAHKGFPISQNVVDAMYEICRLQDGSEMNYYQKEDFTRYIRGLKIDYMIPGNPSSKRTYKVNKIAECPAKLRFELDDGKTTTVQEYFRQVKHVQLRYPHLPCLHVGSLTRKKPIYLPAELCTVSKHQVINKKMNEAQTSAMIKNAATNTDTRKRKIMDMMMSVGFNEDPCVKEFGLSVGGKFEEVEARILDAPKLEYSNHKYAVPRSGVWRPTNFVSSSSLKSWMILNLDSFVKEDTLRRFGEEMQRTGKNYGMNIAPPAPPCSMRPPGRDSSGLKSFFSSVKSKEIDLVVVVVPDRGDTYAKVKQVAELTVGVLTQCVKSRTMQRMNPATCSNILLKVNSKLNGVNHALSDVSKPPCLARPVMFVGADVTHPSPDQTDIPSVAAVCSSHDPKAFKYNIQIRLQPPRVEIIQDLQAIIKEQLMFFYRNTRYKPERIIFYRDGVSEGQFAEVLNSEVTAIRRACSSLDPEYKPMVTFLVVQKRHHTRFFPTRKEDEDGRNCNVPPGTVVDTKITHPIELDFFLVSHASIQGVSRPTKYHVLWNDDEKMTTDELEQLTYYLCHMFSRCTRSVSYPAPTYNAHLAAYRARVYLDGQMITLTNLENEQRKYFESSVLKDIIKQCPMYFV